MRLFIARPSASSRYVDGGGTTPLECPGVHLELLLKHGADFRAGEGSAAFGFRHLTGNLHPNLDQFHARTYEVRLEPLVCTCPVSSERRNSGYFRVSNFYAQHATTALGQGAKYRLPDKGLSIPI